jgi:hypothetical protein
MQSLSYHEHDPHRPLLADDYDESDAPPATSSVTASKYSWYIELASILFFIKGSALYLTCAIYDYKWALQQMSLPPELRGVDDDTVWRKYQGTASADDDILVQIAANGITRYQTLYFFAALSFVMTGILDMMEEKAAFYAFMILAGLFGVASAIYVKSDEHLSDVLDCISVHLFLLEGIVLFLNSYMRGVEERRWYRRIILFSDAQFILGSFLDVMVSTCVLDMSYVVC